VPEAAARLRCSATGSQARHGVTKAEHNAPVNPDGRCHAALSGVLAYGCDAPVPPDAWSCDRHFAQLIQLGQALRDEWHASRSRPSRARRTPR